MRRRRNTARIDRLHLLGVRKDVGQLSGEEMLFVFGELELRQCGNAFDVGSRERGWHVVIVMQNAKFKMQTAL